MATCRACGADITFLLTLRDRPTPVDAEPVKRYIVQHRDGRVVGILVDTFTPHWATCTDPDRFRKKESA